MQWHTQRIGHAAPQCQRTRVPAAVAVQHGLVTRKETCIGAGHGSPAVFAADDNQVLAGGFHGVLRDQYDLSEGRSQ